MNTDLLKEIDKLKYLIQQCVSKNGSVLNGPIYYNSVLEKEIEEGNLDNDVIINKNFVKNEINKLKAGVGLDLDTLSELASAINNDPQYFANLDTKINGIENKLKNDISINHLEIVEISNNTKIIKEEILDVSNLANSRIYDLSNQLTNEINNTKIKLETDISVLDISVNSNINNIKSSLDNDVSNLQYDISSQFDTLNINYETLLNNNNSKILNLEISYSDIYGELHTYDNIFDNEILTINNDVSLLNQTNNNIISSFNNQETEITDLSSQIQSVKRQIGLIENKVPLIWNKYENWNQLGTNINDLSNSLLQGYGKNCFLNNNGTKLAISYLTNNSNNLQSINIEIYEYENLNWNKIKTITPAIDYYSQGNNFSFSNNGNSIAICGNKIGTNNVNKKFINFYDLSGDDYIQSKNELIINVKDEADFSTVSLNNNGSKLVISLLDSNNTPLLQTYKYENNNWVQYGGNVNKNSSLNYSNFPIFINNDGTIICYYGNNTNNKGIIYSFELVNNVWQQMGNFIETEEGELFINSVSLSKDGNTLGIGSKIVSSTNTSKVSVFKWNGETWNKIGNTFDSGHSSSESNKPTEISVALNENGNYISFSGYNATDSSNSNYPLVKSYEWLGEKDGWIKVGNDLSGNNNLNFGSSLALDNSGLILAIGSSKNTSSTVLAEISVFNYNENSLVNRIIELNDRLTKSIQNNDIKVGLNKTTLLSTFDNSLSDLSSNINSQLTIISNELNQIISSAGLNSNGTYNPSFSSIYIQNASNLYQADLCLNNAILDVSNQVTTITNQVNNISFDSSSLSTDLSNIKQDISNLDYNVKVEENKLRSLETINASKHLLVNWGLEGDRISGNSSDNFGFSSKISKDGNTLVVGSPFYDNNKGYVKIYNYSNGNWVQKGATLNGTSNNDYFGYSIDVNENGTKVIIGVPQNNPKELFAFNENNINFQTLGFIQVYNYENNNWSLFSTLNPGLGNYAFTGTEVSINNEGNIIAFGTPYRAVYFVNHGQIDIYKLDSSNNYVKYGNSIVGNVQNNFIGFSFSLSKSGNEIGIISNHKHRTNNYAAVYNIINNNWVLKGNQINIGDYNLSTYGNFAKVSINGDATIIAYTENAYNNNKGRIIVREYSNSSWVNKGNEIIGKQYNNEYFPSSLELNESGNYLIAGSAVDYNVSNINAPGYVKIFKWETLNWTQNGTDIVSKEINDLFGYSVSIDSAGEKTMIGIPTEFTSNASVGKVAVYKFGDYIKFYIQDINNELTDISNQITTLNAYDFNTKLTDISADVQNNFNSVNNAIEEIIDIVMPISTSIYTWDQKGQDFSANSFNNNTFGQGVGLSKNGNILAIGSPQSAIYGDTGHLNMYNWNGTTWVDDGNVFGQFSGEKLGQNIDINSDGTVIVASSSGTNNKSKVKVLWKLGSWQTYDINAPNDNDGFGEDIQLNHAGDIIIIGASNTNNNSGAVYLYTLYNTSNYASLFKTFNGDTNDYYGSAVSINGLGNIIAIGALETSNEKGYVKIYENTNNNWNQLGSTLTGFNNGDLFSKSIYLSSDGLTIAIGAPNNNDKGEKSGAIYIYYWYRNNWKLKGNVIYGEKTLSYFGSIVRLSADGNQIVISGNNLVRDYKWNGSTWFPNNYNQQNIDSTYPLTIAINETAFEVAIGNPYYNNKGSVKVLSSENRLNSLEKMSTLFNQQLVDLSNAVTPYSNSVSTQLTDVSNEIVNIKLQVNDISNNVNTLETNLTPQLNDLCNNVINENNAIYQQITDLSNQTQTITNSLPSFSTEYNNFVTKMTDMRTQIDGMVYYISNSLDPAIQLLNDVSNNIIPTLNNQYTDVSNILSNFLVNNGAFTQQINDMSNNLNTFKNEINEKYNNIITQFGNLYTLESLQNLISQHNETLAQELYTPNTDNIKLNGSLILNNDLNGDLALTAVIENGIPVLKLTSVGSVKTYDLKFKATSPYSF